MRQGRLDPWRASLDVQHALQARLDEVGDPESDAEEDVDGGEVEVGQDAVRHLAVVVLPRVNDGLVEHPAAIQRLDDGRHLHEVRPSADNMHDGGSAVRDPWLWRPGNEDEVRWLRHAHFWRRAYAESTRA